MSIFKIGCTDKPVETVTEDCFNVSTYVDGLCTFIKTCETPMTISIQGDWGSGKTSMMNMIKENTSDKVVPVWFNTWQFSQFDLGDNLVFSMIEVLMSQLDAGNQFLEKLKPAFMNGLKKGAIALTDYTTSGKVAEYLEKLLESQQNYAEDIIKLKKRFQDAVNEKIEKDNKERVVVFVDDLDRLQPSKAVELLEVLKLFLDCENCVFVLAVDYEVVTLGIKQKFGNDVSEEKGKSFFDKIIQLPFKMPVAQYDIKNYVKKTLERMSLNSDDATVDTFVDLIRTSIGFNPRSMKRLFNTYQLLDIISKSTVVDIEDNVRQRILFATICMQMRFENLYKYFASNSSAIDAEELSVYSADDASLKISEDEDFVAVIADTTNDTDKEIKSIVSFMKKFLVAIQQDDNNEISDNEIATLRSVIKCSMVTSVSETQEEQEDIERQYRYENRKLAERAETVLKSKYGEFKRWLPKKAREGVKISDVSYSKVFATKYGIDISLEYYLKRINSNSVSVTISIYDKSSNLDNFHMYLTERPLDCYDIKPGINIWGGYIYDSVLIVDIHNDESDILIAKEWEKAYCSLKKHLCN